MRCLLLILVLASPLWAQPLERKLVLLKRQNLTTWVESHPDFDFTCYLPRRYTPVGLESALLKASSHRAGLPSRLLGNFTGDRVEIPRAEQQLQAVLLPLSLQAKDPWRGVVGLLQDGSQMVRWSGASPQPCRLEIPSKLANGLYEVTAWNQAGTLVVSDLAWRGPLPTATPLHGPLLALVSEGFLRRSLELYRAASPQQFRWQEQATGAGFRVASLGLTTVRPPLRGFASLKGELGGLGTLVEGEWECPLQLELEQGWLHLRLLESGQQVRLTAPFFTQVPESWSNALIQLMNQMLGAHRILPFPGAYFQPLQETGLVTSAEVADLKIHSASWGDWKGGALWMSPQGPSLQGPPQELAWVVPEGFALALSAASLNRCFEQWLPGQLPLQVDLPKGSLPSPQVLLFRLEIHRLELQQIRLRYHGGRFEFEDCQIALHWRLGPLSGVEPGARLGGTAVPTLRQNPDRLALQFSIQDLTFLSPQVLSRPAAEQASLRQQILRAVEATPVDLPVPVTVPTEIHPQARLRLTSLRAEAEHLWLLGGWER